MNEFNFQSETKPTVHAHTVCTTQVDKNIQNRS